MSTTARSHFLRTGASIQRLLVPDRHGTFDDVVLGFEDEASYAAASTPYFGAVAGRVANRIANATFTLDGKTYRLETNEPGFPGSLHGGRRGFDKVQWEAEKLDPNALKHRRRGEAVRFRYRSVAGEEGYPGTLTAEVTYTLLEAGGQCSTAYGTPSDSLQCTTLVQSMKACADDSMLTHRSAPDAHPQREPTRNAGVDGRADAHQFGAALVLQPGWPCFGQRPRP